MTCVSSEYESDLRSIERFLSSNEIGHRLATNERVSLWT